MDEQKRRGVVGQVLWPILTVICAFGWGVIVRDMRSPARRVQAEAVQRGYARWIHAGGRKEAAFKWVERADWPHAPESAP